MVSAAAQSPRVERVGTPAVVARDEAVARTLRSGKTAVRRFREFWDALDEMEELGVEVGDDAQRAFEAVVVMSQCWVNALNKRLDGDTLASYGSELAIYNDKKMREGEA
jgi:hypothetical protein